MPEKINQEDIVSYSQMSEDEIAIHKAYDNLFYHNYSSTKEERLIINESIDRYCRKHNIRFESVFDVSVMGNLIPRKIKNDYRITDIVLYSTKYMLVKNEIESIIKQIRNEFNKAKANEKYDFIWFGK